ncbi:MAG TPA: methylmalonyl-CoA mutase family protein [Candidatus Acidoferrales bacterium]|jgi:methylmalonyl-CoA mutase N-terminal domain/subunit|nr:methylmalonyl-CoA mutase family protein [Candidatus Acidoferrales bacterium]
MTDKSKVQTEIATPATPAAPVAPRRPSPAEKSWEENTLKPTLEKSPERRAEFTTISSHPIRRLYTEADLQDWSPEKDLGLPGEPPYTRGIHSTMHRGRLWTMRQFAGFGTAEDTNARFRYLLAQGQTGLSTAFDLPTLMGYDSDHALSEGEVGKCGVAISSLADMEVLFDKIPLANVTTSMTINSPAAIIWAMYLAVAEKQGADWKKLSGTLQNDILKEYIAQKEYIYPPEPSMRLVIDTFEFGVKNTPKFNPISISGYHIREAGSTAIQELAFTLRDGLEYVEWGMRRGMDVDAFVPQLSFFFNAHNDFFEEIAKYRAARRIWHKAMVERYKSTNPRSWALRFHSQTAGCSLTAQQPYNNVVRTAIQALAAVLGGTQSLHTNSLDEAWALPTEFAATLALRTQQIIAHETGVANTVDPLGGSYFVETLTNEVERGAWDYIHKIDAMGGMVTAIERSYPQREIAEASYRYQMEVDRKEKIVVGVNDFVTKESPLEILQIDETVAHRQAERLRKLRAERSQAEVDRRLNSLRTAARGKENLMPFIYDTVKAYATLGEICEGMRDVFGTYEEVAIT